MQKFKKQMQCGNPEIITVVVMYSHVILIQNYLLSPIFKAVFSYTPL